MTYELEEALSLITLAHLVLIGKVLYSCKATQDVTLLATVVWSPPELRFEAPCCRFVSVRFSRQRGVMAYARDHV